MMNTRNETDREKLERLKKMGLITKEKQDRIEIILSKKKTIKTTGRKNI